MYSNATKFLGSIECEICKESHFIYQCPKFLILSPKERYNQVTKYKLYTNCLRPGHFNSQCLSRNCKKCSNLKHSTSLHDDNFKDRLKSGNKDTATGNVESPQRSSSVNFAHWATDCDVTSSGKGKDEVREARPMMMANRPEELIFSTNNDLISHDLQTNNVVGNVYEMHVLIFMRIKYSYQLQIF